MAHGGSDAVQAALARRIERVGKQRLKILDKALKKMDASLASRVRVATEYLRSKIVQNLSVPVTKTKVTKTVVDPVTGKSKKQSRIVVSDRSKAGEFPRADTTQLMKTIFTDFQQEGPNTFYGYVGTPLDYGAILEISKRLKRSFMVRTLSEEFPVIQKIILTGQL